MDWQNFSEAIWVPATGRTSRLAAALFRQAKPVKAKTVIMDGSSREILIAIVSWDEWFVCLFVSLFACFFVCLFACLLVCLLVCLFVCLFVCLLYIYIFIYMYIYIYISLTAEFYT